MGANVNPFSYDRQSTSGAVRSAAHEYARQLKTVRGCFFESDPSNHQDGASDKCQDEAHNLHQRLAMGIGFMVERLAPLQRHVFLFELGLQLGGTRVFAGYNDTREIVVADAAALNGLKWHPEPNLRRVIYDITDRNKVFRPAPTSKSPGTGLGRNPDLREADMYDRVSLTSGMLVVPVTMPAVEDGTTYTVGLSTDDTVSNAAGSEAYVDVYVSTEIGAKLGFDWNVISVSYDVRAGQTTGKTLFRKSERSKAISASRAVSKTYILQTLVRSAKAWNFRGLRSLVERGFRIERNQEEGGPSAGPFWENYTSDGAVVRDSARAKACAYLEPVLRKAAIDLVQHSLRR